MFRQMDARHRLLGTVATMALGLLLAGWAGCNNGGDGNVVKPDAKAPPVTPNAPPPDKKAAGPEVPADIYPGLPGQLLTPKERATLVRITDAQLCPCKGATVSLHVCLQKESSQCPLAMSSAAMSMQRIKEGVGEKDVLDQMGTFIEAAYKKYEFDLSKTAFIGKPGAPVVIVEFADFECPFCNLARGIVKTALDTHGDNVVFYFKQFPLSFHAHSEKAARAVIAAGRQDRYWQMYDLIFDNQKQLSDQKILQLAQALGLNMTRFAADWADPLIAQQVQEDKKEGETAGVDSTPTFYINGRRYLGEKTPEAFTLAVGDALKAAKSGKK
jgi:protein-disulfide isomerase